MTMPIKWSLHKHPKGWGLESFQVGEHMEMWREWCAWRGHGSAPLLPTHPALCISSIRLFPSCTFFFFKWQITNLVRVLWATLANEWNQRRKSWESVTYSQSIWSTYNNLVLGLAFEAEDSLAGLSHQPVKLMLSPDRLCQHWAEL